MGHANCTGTCPLRMYNAASPDTSVGEGCANIICHFLVTFNWWKKWRTSRFETTTRFFGSRRCESRENRGRGMSARLAIKLFWIAAGITRVSFVPCFATAKTRSPASRGDGRPS